jgi:hypothetical protein
MYQYALTPKAAEQMRRLTKHNPQLSARSSEK